MTEYQRRRARLLRFERKLARLRPGDACDGCGATDAAALEIARDANGQPAIRCANCRARRYVLRSKRRKRRLQDFADIGFSNPSCLLCHEADLSCLQRHHVAGRANGVLQVPLCCNCHARQSDAQIDALADLRQEEPSRSPLVRQAAFQLGLALLLTAFATAEGSGGGNPTFIGFCVLAATAFTAWAKWNVDTDQYLEGAYGTNWWAPVGAKAPS